MTPPTLNKKVNFFINVDLFLLFHFPHFSWYKHDCYCHLLLFLLLVKLISDLVSLATFQFIPIITLLSNII